jgi:adenosine deaminase
MTSTSSLTEEETLLPCFLSTISPTHLSTILTHLPKAELHLHIEGTLEPELAFQLATRNQIQLPYASPELLKQAYSFNSLQSFLDIYYMVSQVLIKEQDFYDLMMAYFKKANENNIWHAEIFFDPQTHTTRGISFTTIMNGFKQARIDGLKQYHISSSLIMCFLRHLTEDDGFQILEQALPYLTNGDIIGIGLDSGEVGNPPQKFINLFTKCKEQFKHLRIVAHAGEEGPSEYVLEALDLLKAERIDHGVKAIESNKVIHRLVQDKIGLTVCPLSNISLAVFPSLEQHTLPQLLAAGILASVNSDDPAFFGGYVTENFISLFHAIPEFGIKEAFLLARNSFLTSFAGEEQKKKWIEELIQYFEKFIGNNKNNQKIHEENGHVKRVKGGD